MGLVPHQQGANPSGLINRKCQHAHEYLHRYQLTNQVNDKLKIQKVINYHTQMILPQPQWCLLISLLEEVAST
jgi:hypothetical protein